MLNLSFSDYDDLLNKMFMEIDISDEDTIFEKRKKVFDYFLEYISYDYVRLYEFRFESKRIDRRLEIQDVLIRRKGICNSLAVTYKLILEKCGIYSMCVCMKGHMINLVQNYDGTFSFDDITKAIMKKDFNNDNVCVKVNEFLDMIRPVGDIYDYFNYSFEKAIKLGQGKETFVNRYTNQHVNWLPISTIDYVYKLIKKNNYDYLYIKYNVVKDYRYLVSLPDSSLIKEFKLTI